MTSQSFQLKPGGASRCPIIEIDRAQARELASRRLSAVPPEVSNADPVEKAVFHPLLILLSFRVHKSNVYFLSPSLRGDLSRLDTAPLPACNCCGRPLLIRDSNRNISGRTNYAKSRKFPVHCRVYTLVDFSCTLPTGSQRRAGT